MAAGGGATPGWRVAVLALAAVIGLTALGVGALDTRWRRRGGRMG